METSKLLKMTLVLQFLILCLLLSVNADCDIKKLDDWKAKEYEGVLSADPEFWRYQTVPQFRLTKGLALEMATAGCVNNFDLLYYYLAGRMGPIDIQHSFKVMCSTLCLESDSLHEEVMDYTDCSCLEISTQPDDPSWTRDGDFCYENSARLLCDRIGYCGIWDCRIDDFMCPRYEWNKKDIRWKGPGTCIRGAAAQGNTRYHRTSLGFIITLSALIFINTMK